MRSSRLFFLIIFSFIFSHSWAQFKEVEKEYYPGIERSYYQFPIKPEQSNYLSGTMGELRSSHFHAGIDIKTEGKEGLDVHSAADGFVARIRVGTGGYGNCLYIQHPNGTFTVYAHLKNFNPEIAEYTLKEQYRRKSFNVNLFPKRNELPVEQGQIIGLSGNSGSSTGPHLHFEIRSSDQKVLDPLRIGFQEVQDNIPPHLGNIALKSMNLESRVNGQFGRFTFQAKSLPDTIEAYGQIGLEMYGYDQLNGASNRNGIPFIDMFVKDELYFSQVIDSIDFSLQKNILVHTNYQAQVESRRRYNKLYIDDGNPLDFYPKRINDGLLAVEPGEVYPVKIVAEDAYGNQSEVELVIKGVERSSTIDADIRINDEAYILDNTLMLYQSRDSIDNKITAYFKEGSAVYDPSYFNEELNVYLIDLRKVLPQKVIYADGDEQNINLSDRVPASSNHSFLSDTYSLQFSERTLFDTIYFQTKHYVDEDTKRDVFEIKENIYPLKGGIIAQLELIGEYDSLEQYQLYSVNNPRYPRYAGGDIEDGKLNFTIYSFGKYTLMKDLNPPVVKSRSVSNNVVRVTIYDDLSGIKDYEANINGKWLLMHYEPKLNLLWSERLDKSKPLKGEFELTVTDNAGNESILKLNLE